VELTLPEELLQDKNKKIAQNILKNEYIKIKICNFSLQEDLAKEQSQIEGTLLLVSSEEQAYEIRGAGKGLVDALFSTIIKKLLHDYISLEGIRFLEFMVSVDLSKGRRKSKSDAPVEICLVISNSSDKELYFRYKSKSIISALINAILKAIEYLINIELAVLRSHESIAEAKERNRFDLVEKWTFDLVELVKTTSYEKLLKSKKKA